MRKAPSFYSDSTWQKILISLLSIFLFFVVTIKFDVNADTVTTAVTVGNTAPYITAGPIENPASTVASPTNVGSNTTWEATAKDNNAEDYYLIICSSNAVSPTNGDAPTCTATT